jgi:hypothetical protein
MEDDDTDAEMVDYETDFSDDVDPNFVHSEFTAVDARTSESRGPGNRESDPPFSRFFPIPDSRVAGNRESGNGPFPDRPGTGNRGPDSAGRGFPGLARLPVPRMALTAAHASHICLSRAYAHPVLLW